VAVDPDERSVKLAGFTPPEAPLSQLPAAESLLNGTVSTAVAEQMSAVNADAESEDKLVVTSQETCDAHSVPPPHDMQPLVSFDVVVSAVTGIAEPVLPEIQTVEVNGERIAVRERTAAEKKGSLFYLSMQLPVPYKHLLLESQPVPWAASLVFPSLTPVAVEGSPAAAGDKLQLPCNINTRNCLRDGFMTLRIMRKTPEPPRDFTDAELEELQVPFMFLILETFKSSETLSKF
jgi:hypothetical protein